MCILLRSLLLSSSDGQCMSIQWISLQLSSVVLNCSAKKHFSGEKYRYEKANVDIIPFGIYVAIDRLFIFDGKNIGDFPGEIVFYILLLPRRISMDFLTRYSTEARKNQPNVATSENEIGFNDKKKISQS